MIKTRNSRVADIFSVKYLKCLSLFFSGGREFYYTNQTSSRLDNSQFQGRNKSDKNISNKSKRLLLCHLRMVIGRPSHHWPRNRASRLGQGERSLCESISATLRAKLARVTRSTVMGPVCLCTSYMRTQDTLSFLK